MRQRILGVIPARGGSKEIPKKNIVPIFGKPLVGYTIKTALESRVFFRLICSTDNQEIAGIAKKYGAEVPFIRPKELAQDNTPMVPVIQHAARFVESEEGEKIDYVFCLQPTNPLRSIEDIKRAVKKIIETKADSVIGVIRVTSDHPIIMKKIENDLLLPYIIEEKEGTSRQDYKPYAYKRAGSVYIIKRDVLMGKNSLWGDEIRPLIVSKESALNINDYIDLEVLKAVMKSKKNAKNKTFKSRTI